MRFKVGDIVKGNSGNYGFTNKEMTRGEVKRVHQNGTIDIQILEHESFKGDAVFVHLDPQYFDLAESAKHEFHVGQIYRVGSLDGRTGNIVKIIDVNCDTFKYDTIRGKDTLNEAQKTSWFAGSLTILKGPQIGEAIRKYDVDHSESETGMRRVKRYAKVGEYVKVTSTDGHSIPMGNVAKATDVDVDGWATVECANGKRDVLRAGQYVVLEGYKPEKEKERKPKVGDTIRILEDVGGPVFPGKIGTITGIHNKWESAKIDGYDYFMVIYRNGDYEIIHSRKHAYTSEQIEQAKKLCGEMMVELLESGKIRIRFQDKENDPPYCDRRTFIYAGKPGYIPTEAYATCSDHDEYNVWIGRCVALCKALHKPIPAFIIGGNNG